MNSARPAATLAHGGRSVADWFTGTGFLALNALAFFTALVVLVPWNIYSEPGDFWTADLFIPWAFVLGFHALLVGVWGLIRSVLLKDTNPLSTMTPTARQWHSAQVRSTSNNTFFRPAPTAVEVTAPAPGSDPSDAWLRSTFVSNSVQQEAPVSASMDSTASEDISDLLADWDTSWPDPVEDQPRNDLVAESPTLTAPEADFLAKSEPVRTPGPLSAAAKAATSSNSKVDPDLEWQWIEASASAWLSSREHDESANS